MFEEPVEAVIFDMDGTLIDSESVYIAAMQDAAGTLGLALPLDLCHAMVGVPSHECNLMLQEHYGPGFDLTVFRGHFSNSVQRRMSERVPVKPGVVELLDFLASAGIAARDRHLGGPGNRGAQPGARRPARPVRRARDPRRRRAPQAGARPLSRSGAAAGRGPGAMRRLRGFRASASSPPMPPACGRSWCLDILPPTDEARAKCFHIAEDLHEVLRRMNGSA